MKQMTLALAALVWLAAAPVFAWTPTGEAETSVAAGHAWAEVSPDADGVAVIRAAVDIAAPSRIVWSVVTDCRLAARMITNLTSCKIIDGDQTRGWDVREQITHGNLFVPAIRNVVRADYQPYSLIRFHKVGGDLKVEEGEWRFEPMNGGAATRVIYVNRVAANISAPASLVRAGLRHDTPKVLLALRRESLAAAKGS